MSFKMNQRTFEEMVGDNISWLDKQECCHEQLHIRQIIVAHLPPLRVLRSRRRHAFVNLLCRVETVAHRLDTIVVVWLERQWVNLKGNRYHIAIHSI